MSFLKLYEKKPQKYNVARCGLVLWREFFKPRRCWQIRKRHNLCIKNARLYLGFQPVVSRRYYRAFFILEPAGGRH